MFPSCQHSFSFELKDTFSIDSNWDATVLFNLRFQYSTGEIIHESSSLRSKGRAASSPLSRRSRARRVYRWRCTWGEWVEARKSRRTKGEPKRAHRGRGRAYSNPNDDASLLPVRGRSLGEARLLLVNCARLPTRFLVTPDPNPRDVYVDCRPIFPTGVAQTRRSRAMWITRAVKSITDSGRACRSTAENVSWAPDGRAAFVETPWRRGIPIIIRSFHFCELNSSLVTSSNSITLLIWALSNALHR